MSGKARPSLRKKTLENVRFCNLSDTDKKCIFEVFKRYEEVPEIVRCKNCVYANDDGTICRCGVGRETTPNGYCDRGERKDDEQCEQD